MLKMVKGERDKIFQNFGDLRLEFIRVYIETCWRLTFISFAFSI